MARSNMLLFQDLDKKLDTLVLQSPAVSEETEKCKRCDCFEIVTIRYDSHLRYCGRLS